MNEGDDGGHDAADRAAKREERLAYLAGLAEGIEQRDDPAPSALLSGIVSILDDLSREIGEVRREQKSLAEDMDELADELGVEPTDVVVECSACGREVAFASSLLDDDELELTCPNCGEIVYTPGEDEIVDGGGGQGRGAEPEPGAAAGRPPGERALGKRGQGSAGPAPGP